MKTRQTEGCRESEKFYKIALTKSRPSGRSYSIRPTRVATNIDSREKLMNKTARVAISLALMVASISLAEGATKANPFKQVLAAVPAAEMPAKAADLISRSKSRDRASTTVDVIVAAIAINPAAAPSIVGAIARSTPYMASVAAGIAAAEQPKQAAAIAKAAAAAAPSQARKIVMAVCRAVPNDHRSIALAVSQVVPTASKEILNAITSCMPELKPYIEQSLLAHGGNSSVLSIVLDDAAKMAQTGSGTRTASATLSRTVPVNPSTALSRQANRVTPVSTVSGTKNPSAISPSTTPSTPSIALSQPGTPVPSVSTVPPLSRGPAVGPPYIPPSTTPTNTTPNQSGPVPPGGRNYAEP